MQNELIIDWVEYLQNVRQEIWCKFVLPIQETLNDKDKTDQQKLVQMKKINADFELEIDRWRFNLEEL